MTRFQPILLGSDINVYGMARAFHEEYGIVSEAYAYFQLSPTKFSRIVNVHIVDDFNNFVTFRNFMLKLGKRMKAEDPERVLLLIPCGDVYANLLSQCGDDLREYFVYNTLDVNLSRRLAYKSTFYQICEQYDLPHPKTRTVTADEVKAGAYRDLPFSYPVAMKPANSVEWLNIDFEGRRKAYIFNDPAELETIIKRAYDAGYTSEMVIQDFIPGDDSRMRVLNAYVDQHHRVRMMFLGHPLLEDPSPVAAGNYAAILPDYNEGVFRRIKASSRTSNTRRGQFRHEVRRTRRRVQAVRNQPSPRTFQLFRHAERLQSGEVFRRRPRRGHAVRRQHPVRPRFETVA